MVKDNNRNKVEAPMYEGNLNVEELMDRTRDDFKEPYLFKSV